MSSEPSFNPFPGLRPFKTDEEYLFFGREGQSEEILRRLREHRFLAVIGTSGSGKSSLIQAGLLPYLYGGFMANAGSHWRVAALRPGSDPIGNLACALNDTSVLGEPGANSDDALRSKTLLEVTLRRSGLGLVEAVHLARLPEQDRVLIVVDQFEELFRFAEISSKTRQQDDAAAFVKLLLEAAAAPKPPIYIVLTMRSEFIGDCAKFRDLPEAVTASPYLIPWMTREQRRLAIEEPVRVGNATIAPRLVNRLLNDGGEDPDQLPILQHCMMRTWDYWEAHKQNNEEPIDLEHYEKVGGIQNALSMHADDAYGDLDDSLKAVAKRVFQALTEKGSDNREIRRPTTIAKIAASTGAEISQVISVVECFRQPGRSFLMPPVGIELEESTVVDISHESLIRGWERLKAWVDEESESSKTYQRLAEAAERKAQRRAALWSDPDLTIALEWKEKEHPNAVWAERYHRKLNEGKGDEAALHVGFDQAMRFLDESLKADQARKAAEERAKLAEEERKAEELRRTRAHLKLVGFACSLFAVALIFAVVFVVKYRRQTKLVTAGELETLDVIFQAVRSSPDSPENEQLLQRARSVSEQMLKDHSSDEMPKMFSALSRGMLNHLHLVRARSDEKKQTEYLEECEANIKEANDWARRGDLTPSAILLESSAENLITDSLNGKQSKNAVETALQATHLWEKAADAFSESQADQWSILEMSYKGAVDVVKKANSHKSEEDTPQRSAAELSVQDKIAITMVGSHPDKVRVSQIKPNLLAHMEELGRLEQDLGKKDQALATFKLAIKLGDTIKLDDKSASGESDSIGKMFWLYSDLGNFHVERAQGEKDLAVQRAEWDEANIDFKKAEDLIERIPDSSEGSDTRLFDRFALFYFLGDAQQNRAETEKDLQRKSEMRRSALQFHEKSAELGEEFEKAHPQQSRLVTTLYLSSIADLVVLREMDRAEAQLNRRITLLTNRAQNNEVAYLSARASRIFAREYVNNQRDYKIALGWNGRGIQSVRQGLLRGDDKQTMVELLSDLYGQRSWIDLFLGDFQGGIRDSEYGFNLDRSQLWILMNAAHGYLLAGKYEQARTIYQPNLDKQIGDRTFREVALDDFKDFLDHGNPKMNLDNVRRMQTELSPQNGPVAQASSK